MSAKDAIEYFKKNPPRKSVEDAVKKNEFNIYLESADMLKTSQTKAALIKNGVCVYETLQSTKKKSKNYLDKLKPFERYVRYTKGEFCVQSHSTVKFFKEIYYLKLKNKLHAEYVEAVIQSAESEDEIHSKIEDSYFI